MDQAVMRDLGAGRGKQRVRGGSADLERRKERLRRLLLRLGEQTGDATCLRAAACLMPRRRRGRKRVPWHLTETRLARMQDDWLRDASGSWSLRAAALRVIEHGHEGHASAAAALRHLAREYREFERRKVEYLRQRLGIHNPPLEIEKIPDRIKSHHGRFDCDY